MSTISLTVNSKAESSKTFTCEFSYNVTSTTGKTTIELTNHSYSTTISTSTVYCRLYIDDSQTYQVIVSTSASRSGSHDITKSVTFDRGNSSQTKTLKLRIFELKSGATSETELGSKSTTFSVPHLDSFTVSYNSNGHGTAPSSQTKQYGVALTLRAAITATGYTFVRWNTNASNTGTGYSGGGSYTANSSATLYAIWNRTVSYNANSGSGAPSSQTALATSAITLTASKPTRTGYNFKEWNTKSDGSGTSYSPGGSYPAGSASVTLYAIWTRTVTYNANGGSGAPSAQTSVITSSIILSTSTPSRDGYTFSNWNTESDGSGTAYNPGATYASNQPNVTLYAQWKKAISSVTIRNASVIRVDSDSSTTEADEGTYAYIRVPYVVQGMAAGDVAMTVTAAADSGTAPTVTLVTYQATKVADSSLTGTFVARASGCSVDVRYTFTITITADNTTVTQARVSASNIILLSSAYFTMDVKAGGHGVHFGGASTIDGFYVSMASVFNGTVLHNNTVTLNNYNTIVKDTDIVLGTKPSSNTYGNGFFLQNSTGSNMGYVRTSYLTNGYYGMQLEARRMVNGVAKYCTINLYIDDSGNAVYTLNGTNAAAAFRSAIDVYSKSEADARYVDVSGDTMTGNLTINKSSGALYLKSTNINSKVGETIPSSNTALGSLYIQDNQGVSSYSQVFKTTDDQLYWSMIVSRYMGDTPVRHGFYQRIYADGTKTVTFYDTASRDAWANGLNVVKKAGDTMSGRLLLQYANPLYALTNTNVDMTKSNNGASSGTYASYLQSYDKNGYAMGQIGFYAYSTGQTTVQITTRNRTTSGTDVSGAAFMLVTLKDSTTYAQLNTNLRVVTNHSVYVYGTNTHATAPSSNTYNPGFYMCDANGLISGYIRQWVTTTKTIGLQIEAGHALTGTRVNTNLYLGVDASGNRVVSTNAAAQWRSAIAAANRTWTSLGSVTNTTALTMDLTNYYEILIVARYSTTYQGSVLIPKAQLSTTAREWYLGGGRSGTGTGQRKACCSVTTTKMTPVQVVVDDSTVTSSATWWVYAR